MSQNFQPLSPSSRTLSEIGVSEGDSAEVRLRKAILLKDHAISKGITISESILKLLNDAECAEKKRDYVCAFGTKIDQALGELTNFTYPTTGDTLLALANPDQQERIERFKRRLPWGLLVAGGGFAIGYLLQKGVLLRGTARPVGTILLAAALGLLGSVLFQIFNTIGVMKEKAFTLDDLYSNSLRIYIGPVVGLLFLFIVEQGLPEQQEKLGGLAVVLPFLAGFSTKLVIGILDKMVQAVMLAFGIEDKRADVLVRQRRNQATAGSVPPGGGDDDSDDTATKRKETEATKKSQVKTTSKSDESDSSATKDSEITNSANDAQSRDSSIERQDDQNAGTTNLSNKDLLSQSE